MQTALAGGRRAPARCVKEAPGFKGPGLQQLGGVGLSMPKIKMKNKESPLLVFGSVTECIWEQLLFRIRGPQPNTGAELRLQKDPNVSPFVLLFFKYIYLYI